MTKQPILGEDVVIDVDRLLVSRLLLQANSGGGKSYALRRLLEQTFGLCQHIVIDPEGEFHTLREKFGYTLVGEGGEAAARVDTAALLAIRLLELGTSAILDISDLGPAKPTFVAKFLDAFVDAPRELWRPVLVVVDEAHRFCPERGKARKKEESESIEESSAAVIRLMDSGRKRPFCGVLATQRLAKLSKDATAECNNVMIGRSIGADAKRAGEELDLSAREAKQTLRKLQAGQFYVFGPALFDDVRLIKVGKVETTHPEPGKAIPPTTPPPAEVRKVLGKLGDLPKEAAEEARTVEQLRAKVKRLEAASSSKGGAPAGVTIERIEIEKRVEVQVIDPESLALLVKGIEDLGTRTAELDRARDRLAQAQQVVVSEMDNLRVFAAQLAHSPNAAIAGQHFAHDGKESKRVGKHAIRTPKAKAAPTKSQPASQPANDEPSAEPPPSSKLDLQSILDALATLDALGMSATIPLLSAWLGVHPKTKSFLASLGALRRDGLLDKLQLTGNGRAVAKAALPASDDERRAMLRERRSELELRILDTIASVGRDLKHNELAAWLGMHPKTKGLLEGLGQLRTLGMLNGNTLTQLGRLVAAARKLSATDLVSGLDESPRRLMDAVLRNGGYDNITELAADLKLHPKTKSLLTDLGALRARGMLTSGWPLAPTDVFAGGAS